MSEVENLEDIAPLDRAAILLLAVGEEQAAEILRRLEPREVQRVGAAMSALGTINNDQIATVVSTFLDTVSGESGLTVGANDYLRKMLTSALGEQKASSVMEKIVGGSVGGLDKLKWMDARAVADFIIHEHPQIQAIVLSYLEADQAAEVLGFLPDNAMRSDVIIRVANLESIPPGALQELSAVLDQQVSKQPPRRFAQLGGRRTAAEIMNNLENNAEEEVMESIRESDESLGDEIQELMFVFDNLNLVDDRGIQTLLREVSSENLVLALKGADEPLREKIFGNMSKRAAELLQDDMEAKGPVRVSEVEVAQKEILTIARKLADAGEIMLGGAGGEEML
ncbi:MAG: flagellar motor switch protein FliG [Gammaproteobacteria bacterium]|nr:flagellar motor switch protein FliG [Gammaproteobacteria bacterium]